MAFFFFLIPESKKEMALIPMMDNYKDNLYIPDKQLQQNIWRSCLLHWIK